MKILLLHAIMIGSFLTCGQYKSKSVEGTFAVSHSNLTNNSYTNFENYVSSEYLRCAELIIGHDLTNSFTNLLCREPKFDFVSEKEHWSIAALKKAGVFENAPYDLLNPTSKHLLPDILKEISGIALDNEGALYCVQDELGVVFQYDLEKSLITKQYRFTNAGDFEDLTIKGDSIFVLRSDGSIFGFVFPNKTRVNQNMISLDATDYESLSYNVKNDLFYMVSKDKGSESGKSKRVIYSFKLDKSLNPQVEITIDIQNLNEVLAEKYPSLYQKKFKFNPSAIAIHPQTDEIYVLSATDKMLIVYESKGLKAIYPLPSELYHKPEGMTFGSDGTLYISSEGEKKGLTKGNIYKFSPH